MSEIELFTHSWTQLRAAVSELGPEDFERRSGCTGWLVRDLVCHLIIDAQDVLITLATLFVLQGVNLGVTKAITNQVAVSNMALAAITMSL